MSCVLRRRLGTVVGVAALLVTVASLASSHDWGRTRIGERENVADRLRFLQAGIGIIRSPAWRPLLGIGYGGYAETAYAYMPPRSYYDATRAPEADQYRALHNEFLRVLIEHGLVGEFLFLGVIGALVYRTVRAARWRRRDGRRLDGDLALALMAGITAVLVSGASHNALGESQVMSAFWVLCALLASERALDVQQVGSRRVEEHG